jgi:RNA polymerase sigma-70 factor (ECF subfamily)
MQVWTGRLVEAAYTEHQPMLVRYLTQSTRDVDVAQDLTQEAFIRLAREIEAGREPNDTGAWLRRVAANLAVSRGRHRQVVDRHAGTLTRPSEPASPEEIVVESELAEAVGGVMAQLSGTERRALVLAANGYGAIEIAASVGRSPGATRTLLCRARSKIRERVRLAGFAAV